MRPYGNPRQLEKRRRHAIQLLKQGMKVSAVAKQVGSSHSSVILWRDRWRQDGFKALAPKPTPGRPSKLKSGHRESLTRLLLKGPLQHGYSTDLWTTRRVAEVVKKRLGIQYHPNHVWRLLRGLGWSCQKPEKRALERDERAISRWKREKWPSIKKNPKVGSPSGFPR